VLKLVSALCIAGSAVQTWLIHNAIEQRQHLGSVRFSIKVSLASVTAIVAGGVAAIAVISPGTPSPPDPLSYVGVTSGAANLLNKERMQIEAEDTASQYFQLRSSAKETPGGDR
jgi:hypothetical protein